MACPAGAGPDPVSQPGQALHAEEEKATVTDVAAHATAQLSDRYLLGDVLGVGGTATVYRATHRTSGRTVAIKVYAAGVVGSDALPSHCAETAALTALRHPGLVEIYESGLDADCAYLVMRLVEGHTLTDRIRQGPLPVADIAALGAALADALAHVHAHGVVHRDVKPSNILLDTEQVPFLADFGISRLIDATRRTATGVIAGTPAFMAPEQVRGRPVGPPTDIYALGLVLLEAATAQREYPGDVLESAIARLHRDPVVPSGLPEPYRRLLAEMTAQEPASRPTAADVAARLRGEPETAVRNPSRVTQKQGVIIATAAAAVLLAAATFGLSNLDGPTTTAPASSPTSSAAPPPSTESAAPTSPSAVPKNADAANSAPTTIAPVAVPARAASSQRTQPIAVEQSQPVPAEGSDNAQPKQNTSNDKKPKKEKKR